MSVYVARFRIRLDDPAHDEKVTFIKLASELCKNIACRENVFGKFTDLCFITDKDGASTLRSTCVDYVYIGPM